MNKGIFFFLVGISALLVAQRKPVQIAFLSDVHFQDLYGSFSDNSFKGIINPKTGKPTILRTMDSQLHSTRVFNENYFAFLKALDDIAAKGIRIVAMPGDFTDDGQAYNLRGLRKVLDCYHQQYGIRFYLTTGNHDPVGPFRQEGGKDDFLGEDGRPLGIYSAQHTGNIKNKIITRDIAESGYLEILDELKGFGFYPDQKDLYWSTPFDTEDYGDYAYSKALQNASYSKRMYEVSEGFTVPDLSYVVEPVRGVWMIAIDGNTYIPKNIQGNPNDPENYHGASIGYNNVLSHKKHLVRWVAKLAAEAKANHKVLIAFTHYPMVDFNDGATGSIKTLLGEKKWQLERVPEKTVARAFAEAGLQVHFAGHMHINDTGLYQSGDQMLVNVQVPSLAAYLPGYKILTIHAPERLEVQTEILNEVPHFNDLFPLYKKEYATLKATKPAMLWNKDILKTKSYHDFMQFHLRELVRLRMIPGDWPKDFVEKISAMTGEDLLRLVHEDKSLSGIHPEAFRSWTGEDLLLDLYKFQSADELARRDIPEERLKQYSILEQLYVRQTTGDAFVKQLQSVFKVLSLLSHGDPADHFEINLKSKKIKRLQD
ncbi:metallophosphoesterase [uncultured Chryseobacterium sp.]|uniref:metallophosphoesterase family protein n=1 Tax=uncultured Chryseobacterium sp. TaxID=259322 RepID=UPI0025F75CDC|nr:metallophosphoesterase [uncultured Chryseobacterium sp.]